MDCSTSSWQVRASSKKGPTVLLSAPALPCQPLWDAQRLVALLGLGAGDHELSRTGKDAADTARSCRDPVPSEHPAKGEEEHEPAQEAWEPLT